MLNKRRRIINNIIKVNQIKNTNKAIFKYYKNNKVIINTQAWIGENGMTYNKIEGDKKTPIGIFNLGIAIGKYERSEICLNKDISYMKINSNLFWIDDINSKYYNQLVDSRKIKKDWKSAENLQEHIAPYEYAIEIKSNANNIPGKRKCYSFTLYNK